MMTVGRGPRSRRLTLRSQFNSRKKMRRALIDTVAGAARKRIVI
jgi:hypothetical protein